MLAGLNLCYATSAQVMMIKLPVINVFKNVIFEGVICKIGKLSTSCKSMFKRKDSYIEPRVTQFFILKYPLKQELTFVVCYLPYNLTFFKGSFI